MKNLVLLSDHDLHLDTLTAAQNENSFWGFGAVYFTFNDFDAAQKQYEEGLQLNPNGSNIITDQATIFLTKFQQNKTDKDLDTAIELFQKSHAIDSKNENTVFKLSVCYFFKSDCKNALKYFDEAKLLGGKHVPEEYSADLRKQCST